ncbi:MAG: protein kinase [Acidobacteria bacterium]|nr:protein kinase [Acidobacteriota bacterium]
MMIGETLSHFKIIEELGQGKMGIVYRGVDLDLDRPVAIKFLPPESQQNEESVARFLRDAKTASQFQHPAVASIYEFGVRDHLRYLVMEYIAGKTLKEVLRSGPLPLPQLLDIAIQVADALSLADEKGIIHSDIKSENIMLTDRGQVKIRGFGLAKLMETSDPAAHDNFQAAGNLVIGTVSYMSPEQALGDELDVRTDIYSAGVVLYEMAAGTLPFTGNSPSVVLAKVLNQPPSPLADYNAKVPPSLQKVIVKCLEKDRGQRYQNALSLLADLRASKQEIEQARDGSGAGILQPGKGFPIPPPPAENLRAPGPSATPSSSSPPVPAAATPLPDVSSSPSVAASGTDAFSRLRSGRTWRLGACFALKITRKVLTLAAGLFTLACIALFILSVFKPEVVANVPGIPWLHLAVDPVLNAVAGLVNFNFRYNELDFLLLALALATYILQAVVTWPLERLELWIREPLVSRQTTRGSVVYQATDTSGISQATRMSLLREYAASKRMLSDVKKEMAFLAIDVVGSTKMKIGEEKLSIEHAFAEYKKFLERIFHECHVYKVAWTPDGVMCAFYSVEDAAAAARKLLVDLDWFNRDVHHLRTKFHVRCGINLGQVLFPEDKPLEEISDEAIDLAGHLQKEADPDTLWVSGEVYHRLQDRTGLIRLDTQVDQHDVFAWRKPS